jgi:hypothetical protein
MSVVAHETTPGDTQGAAPAGGRLLQRMSIVTALAGGLIVMLVAHYLAAAFFVMPELPEGTDPPSGLVWITVSLSPRCSGGSWGS